MTKRRKQIVTPQDETKIRKLLCYPLTQPLPRCPARDRRKMRKFEAQGDFSHSGYDHVCDKCGCSDVAGLNTWHNEEARGFYGKELAHCGTYGVGFCYIHTLGCHKTNWLKRAVDQRRLLQQQGMSDIVQNAQTEEMERELQKTAEKSDTAIEMRKAMQIASDYLQRFVELCENPEKKKDRVYHELVDIHETLKSMDTSDSIKEQCERILELAESIGTLTETSKSGPVKASDVTRFKTVATLTSTAAKIASHQWKIESTSAIHVDEVRSRLWKVYLMTQEEVNAGRMGNIEEFKENWLRKYQKIWSSTEGVL